MSDPENLMADAPRWEPIERFLKVLAKARRHDGSWEWFNNSKCKYVGVRVDMRTGDCILFDRNGEFITFDELEYQYGRAEEGKERKEES